MWQLLWTKGFLSSPICMFNGPYCHCARPLFYWNICLLVITQVCSGFALLLGSVVDDPGENLHHWVWIHGECPLSGCHAFVLHIYMCDIKKHSHSPSNKINQKCMLHKTGHGSIQFIPRQSESTVSVFLAMLGVIDYSELYTNIFHGQPGKDYLCYISFLCWNIYNWHTYCARRIFILIPFLSLSLSIVWNPFCANVPIFLFPLSVHRSMPWPGLMHTLSRNGAWGSKRGTTYCNKEVEDEWINSA